MRRAVSTALAVLGAAGLLLLAAWWLGAGRSAGKSGQTDPNYAQTAAAAATDTRPADGSLRVMTVNIRLDDPSDGINAWPNRRDFLVKTVLVRNPDIIGCQEVSPVQGAYLIKELHGFAHYPRGKAEGNEYLSALAAQVEGTLSGLDTVFYRDDRLELLEGANGLVLPNELQNNASENTFFALLVLRDRAKLTPDLIVINTHLRHGAPFAERCAVRLRAMIGDKLKNYPHAEVVLMGDMNHDRTEKVYAALTGAPLPGNDDGLSADGVPVLKDTFDYAQKGPKELWGNWHAFTGQAQRVWPSDLIFVHGAMAAAPAQFVRDMSPEGRFPSDHFFVWTALTPR